LQSAGEAPPGEGDGDGDGEGDGDGDGEGEGEGLQTAPSVFAQIQSVYACTRAYTPG